MPAHSLLCGNTDITATLPRDWTWLQVPDLQSTSAASSLPSRRSTWRSSFYESHPFDLKVQGDCEANQVPPLPKEPDARLVDASGSLSHAGLLQVRTNAGWGSVCGMNAKAADMVCNAMGYVHGWVSNGSCSRYGGALNMCGAEGTPVAMGDLKCYGHEQDLSDCSWSVPDESCMNHQKDSVVWCSNGDVGVDPTKEGTVRLLNAQGEPTSTGEGRLETYHDGNWAPVCRRGFTPGTAAVACKQMGFSGVAHNWLHDCKDVFGENLCGENAPHMKVTCTGKEDDLHHCPKEVGEDEVGCEPEESVVIKCTGDGDTAGELEKLAAPLVASSMPSPQILGVLLSLTALQRTQRGRSFAQFL